MHALKTGQNTHANSAPSDELAPISHAKNVYLTTSCAHWQKLLKGLGYNAITQDDSFLPSECVAVIVDHEFDPDLDNCQMFSENHKVILVSDNDEFDFRLAAARAGVSAVLSRTLGADDLGAWLTGFEESSIDEHTILIVDDDPLLSQSYALALMEAGMDVHVENDPTKTIAAVTRVNPELVIMDMHMPGANGLEVSQVLRQFRQNQALPILFLSAEKDEELRQTARRVGGDVFITKPVDLSRLVETVKIRAERAHALRQVMEKDSLTGLLNHARFKDSLALEMSRAARTGTPMTVAILDLDHFKTINDCYGHLTGDKVIQTLAHSLRGGLRRTDIVSRYGGEEFAIVLLDTPMEAAQAVLDKIRVAFSEIDFEAKAGKFNVTLSAGMAQLTPGNTVEDIIQSADEALYSAKHSGRNCIKQSDRLAK